MRLKIAAWAIPWLVFGFMVIVSAAVLLPSRVVPYSVEVPYIDTEKYTVQVPYEAIEEDTVRIPYQIKEPYVVSIPVEEEENIRYLAEITECYSPGQYTPGKSTATVQNVDTERARFTVRIGYYDDPSGKFIYETQKKTIDSLTSQTFIYAPITVPFLRCGFQINDPPIKTVVEYRQVIQEREITTFREETRYRKVTKYRNETREREVRKTRTETRQKEVNWLFDFDAIIRFRELG